MNSRVLLIIPAFNEALNIGRVVDNLINNYPQYDYVIVNDGSQDDTGKICRENKYNVVNFPINLGLDAAFQVGMKYAYSNGFEYALQYDGDGQHNAEYIQVMLDRAEQEQCDIVIGSRFLLEKKPWSLRMTGSRIIAACILLTTGITIKDPTSGMRLYGKRCIEYFAQQPNFNPEPDTIAFFARCRFKIQEVQIYINERNAGESYFDIITSLKYMAKVCSSILLVQWFRPRIS